MKTVVWVGSTRKDLRAFPVEARARAGYELYRVQFGLEPTDWEPMSAVGEGVKEIRVRTGREHRLVYIAKFPDALYVLHAFEKKTQRTTRSDIELARTRFRELLARRLHPKSPTPKR